MKTDLAEVEQKIFLMSVLLIIKQGDHYSLYYSLDVPEAFLVLSCCEMLHLHLNQLYIKSFKCIVNSGKGSWCFREDGSDSRLPAKHCF